MTSYANPLLQIDEYKRIRELLIKALCRATGRSREAVEEGPMTCAVEHAKEVERLRALFSAAPPPDDEAVRLLRELNPYLDRLVCYASTTGEYEPNRIVVEVRAYLARKEGE